MTLMPILGITVWKTKTMNVKLKVANNDKISDN